MSRDGRLRFSNFDTVPKIWLQQNQETEVFRNGEGCLERKAGSQVLHKSGYWNKINCYLHHPHPGNVNTMLNENKHFRGAISQYPSDLGLSNE